MSVVRPGDGSLFGARARLGLFLAAALTATLYCAGYPFMAVLRSTWQSHYPQLASQWSNNGRWSLIGWYGTELSSEELAYAARVADASRRFPAVDPYIRESTSLRQTLNDFATYVVMGTVRKAVGDINQAWVLLRWLSALAWFILVFLLARRAGVPEPAALFAAAFVTCFSYILTLLFLHALSWQGSPVEALAKNAWALLSFGRTEGVLRLPRPGVSYAFSFAATLAAIVAAERRLPLTTAGAMFLGALLAYVRLDVWTTHVIATAAFAAVRGLRARRWPSHEAAVALAAALGGLPVMAANWPADPELLARNAIIFAREFHPVSLPYLAFFLHAVWRARTPAELFFGAISLGSFCMTNLELVTGYRLQPEHWWYFGNIYAFLQLAARLPARLGAPRGPWVLASALAVCVAFLQGLAYAAIHFPFQGLPRGIDDGLRWLERNAPPESVVMALNPEVVALTPVFTRSKTTLSFGLPIVSDFPTAANAARLAGAVEFLGVDRARLTDECVTNLDRGDRRELVASGLKRGTLECGALKFLVFFELPLARTMELWEAARPDPSVPDPDFVWVGPFERRYMKGPFARTGYAAAYESPELTIYRRL